jgi:hypothetical protein
LATTALRHIGGIQTHAPNCALVADERDRLAICRPLVLLDAAVAFERVRDVVDPALVDADHEQLVSQAEPSRVAQCNPAAVRRPLHRAAEFDGRPFVEKPHLHGREREDVQVAAAHLAGVADAFLCQKRQARAVRTPTHLQIRAICLDERRSGEVVRGGELHVTVRSVRAERDVILADVGVPRVIAANDERPPVRRRQVVHVFQRSIDPLNRAGVHIDRQRLAGKDDELRRRIGLIVAAAHTGNAEGECHAEDDCPNVGQEPHADTVTRTSQASPDATTTRSHRVLY